MMDNALDLINQYKAEINILIRKKDNLRDEIAEQQAEIERLHKELKITREYIHKSGLEWDLLSYKKKVSIQDDYNFEVGV